MEIEENNSLCNHRPTDVNEKVTEWLARQFNTENWNITDLLKTQNATVYLLIWPIMEQRIFSGFMQGKKIDPISEQMGLYFDEIDVEQMVRYFYDRYQDRDNYNRLTDGRLFNLYLMIAISPLPIATAIGKPTRFVFYNFVKSFLSVVLEALIVVLVLYIHRPCE
jgi:hypothetical protein